MSVFPRWKSILVVVVLLVGTLVALPNVYGEAPALQLSRKTAPPSPKPASRNTPHCLPKPG